ncbi:hypothetical protein V8C40DRAFT_108114 [Trichoderma camerunense]
MRLLFSVLFCQNTKLVLEHIKPEVGAKILRVTEKRGEGRRWVGLAFFIVIFYLLIVCLMAYERGWIGGALCLYIYVRYTWSIYICEIADDGDLKDT